MQNLSKVSLASWAIFLLFVLSVLPNSFRIYWIWASLSIFACAFLLLGIRTGRGLVLTNSIAIALFFATYALHWMALSKAIYAEVQGEPSIVMRLENWIYLVVGNLQQGKFWTGLEIAYVQLVMPCIQLALLVALLIVRRSKAPKLSA